MPTENTATKSEPMRTRKSSKKEPQKIGSGDIKEAFKMAAAKEKEVSLKKTKANTEATLTNINETLESHEEQWCHRDIAIQVSYADIAHELGKEATSEVDHDKADKACFIDYERQEMLEAIQELTEKYNKLDDVVNHPKTGTGAKIVGLTLRGDTMYSAVHGANNGALVRLDKMQKDFESLKSSLNQMEQNQKRFSNMMAENKRLAADLLTAQGLLQKYSQKIHVLENKVLDLTRRGMEQNLIIHGIEEVPNEDCYDAVEAFVRQHLEFQIDEADVWRAYRLGVPKTHKARPMFVKFSYYAKDRIMDNVAMLKNKRNVHNQVLFISAQIPEGITETRKTLSKRASILRDEEKTKPQDQRREVKIMGEHVVVGGSIAKPEVITPQPFELFPGVEEQRAINTMNQKLVETQPKYNKNSTFVGLAVEVKSVQETQAAYKAAMQRFPYMDHVMMAYQLREKDTIKKGSCDDSEYGGGGVIAKFLQDNKMRNIAVFVVRRYGGIHLGFDRFQAIEKTAEAAVQLLRPHYDSSPPASRSSPKSSDEYQARF